MANVDRVIGEKYKLSDESEDCPTCKKWSRKKLCIDCNVLFCAVCEETGDKGPVHSSHNVTSTPKHAKALNLEEADVGSACDEHPGREIEKFCKLHDVLCCSECVKEYHGSCSTLTISNAYDDLAGIETEDKTMENLSLAKQCLIDTIQLHKDVKKVLENDKDKVMKAVQEFRASMEQMLEDLESSTVSSLSKACENIESAFRKNAEVAEKYLSGILKYEKEMKMETRDKSKKFVVLKKAGQQIELSRIASEKRLKPPVREIHFKPNEKICALMQEAETLGKYSFLSYDREYSKKEPYTMVCSGQIKADVKTEEEDNRCEINRICTTPNGNVLLVDHANKKLKQLERPSYNVLHSINIEQDLTEVGLCAIDNNEVMICTGKQIMFVSVLGKMELIRTLNLSHDCLCLGYHDGKIFVSDSSGIIHLYSISGTPISEINTDVYANSLVCSEDGNLVYVGAEEELVAIDMFGTIAWKCCPQDLGMSSISDVCVDGYGHVVVCGSSRGESNDIVVFVNSDGEDIGSYDGGFDHYYHPTSVSFDKQHLKIVVANCFGGTIDINDMRYNGI